MDALPPLANVLRYGNVRQTDAERRRRGGGWPGGAHLHRPAAAPAPRSTTRRRRRCSRGCWPSTAPSRCSRTPSTARPGRPALRRLADQQGLHGLLAGRCLPPLCSTPACSTAEEAARRMGLALSSAGEPAEAAAWVEGLPEGSGAAAPPRRTLWRDPRRLGGRALGRRRSRAAAAAAPHLLHLPAPERRQMGERAQHGGDRRPRPQAARGRRVRHGARRGGAAAGGAAAGRGAGSITVANTEAREARRRTRRRRRSSALLGAIPCAMRSSLRMRTVRPPRSLETCDVMARHDERLRRWRLILGGDEADGTGVRAERRRPARIDGALAARCTTSERSGGLGGSAPNVARWLGDIRSYFPASVVQVMQQDALERLNLRQMLLEPELLAGGRAGRPPGGRPAVAEERHAGQDARDGPPGGAPGGRGARAQAGQPDCARRCWAASTAPRATAARATTRSTGTAPSAPTCKHYQPELPHDHPRDADRLRAQARGAARDHPLRRPERLDGDLGGLRRDLRRGAGLAAGACARAWSSSTPRWST